jgi:cytochrome b
MKRIPVWDLPTRLFHWLLVATFLASWISHELGEIELHFYAGYAMLGLLLFRFCWGFVGSRHARFGDFAPSPGSVIAYLRGSGSPTPGHNPLGALSVITILLLLMTQTVTGLLNGDDEGNVGPYHLLLPEGWGDVIGTWHGILFDALLAVLLLHVLAIIYYQLKGKSLIGAMLSGFKPSVDGKGPPVSLWRAIWVALVCSAAVSALLYLAPEIETEVYF